MSEQTLRPEQTLSEAWTLEVERVPRQWTGDRTHRSRLRLPHSTIICTHGEGATVDAARIDVLVRTAAGYVELEEEDGPAVRDETLDALGRAVRREQARRRRTGLRVVS